MKLLYITNGITGSGGLERVLSVKASALAEDFGYEVHILSLNEEGKQPFFTFSPSIVRHSISVSGNAIRYVVHYRNALQGMVEEIKPDIISVCDDGLKGFFIPKFLKTSAKIIYERHVSKLIEARSGQGRVRKLITRTKWILMENLASSFSKFIVLTDGNKREWPALNNLEVIPNPLSFYPDASSALNNKTVICVGKICYQKGHDLLVKAWELVYQKYPDWRLELYGKADESFLSRAALAGKNVFHFPPEKNIVEKYMQSSIYVLPSRFEGFGMVLIEAMACGVPCISFDCDYGPADIIRDNEDGLLVNKGNIAELAAKIIILIENRELRQRFGCRAKENVQRFEVQVITGQWDCLFKELVPGK